jgi:hypothetical protein
MITKFKARFDGKVLVPQEPIDLPVDQDLELRIVRSLTPKQHDAAADNDSGERSNDK